MFKTCYHLWVSVILKKKKKKKKILISIHHFDIKKFLVYTHRFMFNILWIHILLLYDNDNVDDCCNDWLRIVMILICSRSLFISIGRLWNEFTNDTNGWMVNWCAIRNGSINIFHNVVVKIWCKDNKRCLLSNDKEKK